MLATKVAYCICKILNVGINVALVGWEAHLVGQARFLQDSLTFCNVFCDGGLSGAHRNETKVCTESSIDVKRGDQRIYSPATA